MTTSTTAAAEAAQLTPAFDLDADRLAAELAAVTSHTWNVQRTHTYGGQVGQPAPIDWRVLPLRSLGGDAERTDPGGPGPQPFTPTRWLEQLPYLARLLDQVPAPLNAVRLMALGPGAVSAAHCDPKYRLDRGLARLHIPIVTTPDAVLVLDGVDHCWQPSTLWYGDFSRKHLVRNTSDAVTRVHVVIDALLTAELASWFPASWQELFARGEVLLNRPAPTTAPAWTAALPYDAFLPSGFADFDAAAPLDGSLLPARLDRADGDGLALTVAGRCFALLPAGDGGEWRFSGWSEQRTLAPGPDGGLLLRVRRGRALADRHVPAEPRTP
ncbi:aspartyl/asparaginyl beta-hydroxylase domain-containing protein [Streptomyces sp. MBT49]|uniref:aspartyl/asparaginyl beta-hydroxylase domain-containing protein n=1 Tax=Streptomyces sp. MBT49 TaxID=1488380 RepID=UPI00190D0DF4|nr:aspartyl/asparaginyl beta-hydroxylase domain-containing protein [Streptomyces sp. MBT49]MBK3623301.1 aspartyl/asparaginyl beta-hydroxylase domain-containing protein [Streptomyces sp. MBT49]